MFREIVRTNHAFALPAGFLNYAREVRVALSALLDVLLNLEVGFGHAMNISSPAP